MNTSIDQLKKRVDNLTDISETDASTKVLVIIPDNGRLPGAIGRTGNTIVYDSEHPAESFMTPEERRASTRFNIDPEDRNL